MREEVRRDDVHGEARSTPEVSEHGEEIRFQFGSNRPKWVPRLGLALLIVTATLSLGQLILTGRVGIASLFWIVVCGAVMALPRLFSSEVVADEVGIRARPYINVTWDRVECVVKPSRFDDVVRVRLVGGGEKITGFPPRYAAQMAALGNKQLRE